MPTRRKFRRNRRKSRRRGKRGGDMCDEECLALHSNDTYNSRLDKNSAKIGQFFIYKYNGASPNDMAVARLSSGDKENGFKANFSTSYQTDYNPKSSWQGESPVTVPSLSDLNDDKGEKFYLLTREQVKKLPLDGKKVMEDDSFQRIRADIGNFSKGGKRKQRKSRKTKRGGKRRKSRRRKRRTRRRR